MFQLQGAIIRPLYKNRSLSGFWCMIGIPIVYITGVLLSSIFTSFLTKLGYCIQQYPSNVNNWDPNPTPKTR